MRLTNVLKNELIEKAAHYIFDVRIDEIYKMAEEAADKIVDLFVETLSYKKNREVYENNKEYFRSPVTVIEEIFFEERGCRFYENTPDSIRKRIESVIVKRKVPAFVTPFYPVRYNYIYDGTYYMPCMDRVNKTYYFDERAALTFEDEATRKNYEDIYMPIYDACYKLQTEITQICDKLAESMKYMSNTTQLFTVLPNMIKFIPNVKVVSGIATLEVNTEINDLLN